MSILIYEAKLEFVALGRSCIIKHLKLHKNVNLFEIVENRTNSPALPPFVANYEEIPKLCQFKFTEFVALERSFIIK